MDGNRSVDGSRSIQGYSDAASSYSLDGSRTLQGASDEAFTYECDPCKSEDKVKEAKHFCQTCKEYLCDDCRNYHKKFKEMRNHAILSGSLIHNQGAGDQGIPGVKCSCNKNLVEVYCSTHKEVVCGFCKTVIHSGRCATDSIQDYCASKAYPKSGGLDRVIRKTKALQAAAEQRQSEEQTNRKTFEKVGDDCIEAIKQYRSKIVALLDNMEQSMLKEISQFKNQQNCSSAQRSTMLANLLHMIQADSDMLDDAKKGNTKEVMFATSVKISKNIEGYETALSKLKEDVDVSSVTFKENSHLEREIRENGLGKITISGTELLISGHDGHHAILDMNVISLDKVNVKLPNDEGTRNIGGVAFMPNGKLIIIDCFNRRAKLLDDSFAIEDSLFLSEAPFGLWDVTALDNTTAIVTSPFDKTLLFVHTAPKLREGQTIQVDDQCYSVAMLNDELYVSCSNTQGDKGYVLVLDYEGKQKRKIGETVGRLEEPRRITVSTVSRKIFVSDYATDTVTCLTPEGTILYQYQDSSLRRVHGLYVDCEDNVLICSITGIIVVLTANSVKYKTLLSSTSGLRNSQAIDFRPSDNTLVVGCWNDETLWNFKLS